MKPSTRQTRRQLALILDVESRPPWPAELRPVLIAALADLLLEALAAEASRPLPEGHDHEPEDQR